MLDFTKAAIKKTIADFKKFVYVITVITQAVYLVYLIYALCTGAGKLAVNIAMLTVSASYFVFFLCVTEFGKSPDGKKELKKTGNLVFKWCKRLINLYSLGVMLYGLYATTQNVSWLSVLLSAFMVVSWVLQLVFDVFFRILELRVKFLLEGLEADVAKLMQPAKTVGNFFKKITGKEVEPEKPLTKNQEMLKAMVDEEKEEKKARKKQKSLFGRKKKEAQKEIAPTDGDER